MQTLALTLLCSIPIRVVNFLIDKFKISFLISIFQFSIPMSGLKFKNTTLMRFLGLKIFFFNYRPVFGITFFQFQSGIGPYKKKKKQKIVIQFFLMQLFFNAVFATLIPIIIFFFL